MTFDEFPTMHFSKTAALRSNQKLGDECERYTSRVQSTVGSFKRKWCRDAAHDSEFAHSSWERQRGRFSVKLTTLLRLREGRESGCKYMRVTQIAAIRRGLTGEGYSSRAKALLRYPDRNSPSFSAHSSFTPSSLTSSAPGHDFMHIIKT